jgi:serine/threonine-protein kinase
MKKSIKSLMFIILLISVILTACNAVVLPNEPIRQTSSTVEPTNKEIIEPTDLPTLVPTETSVPPTPTVEATLVPTEAGDPNFRISEKDQSEQIFIPAGEFIMGTEDIDAQHTLNNGVAYPEVPMHIVTLDGYWIDKYEVTNGRYALCVADGGCSAPWVNFSNTREEYYGNPEFVNYPVIMVDWWQSSAFCEWAGGRLPTEAEWEKAARGTDGRKYPWGNNPISGDKVNFCDKNCPREHANPGFDDGYADTAPVGSYPNGASPYGVMDMAGNVWEWTSSIPKPYPYEPDGSREIEYIYEYIWRGGPWSNGTWWVRSTLRYKSLAKYWYENLGFRCAYSE